MRGSGLEGLRVLLTGANGFVGSALVRFLQRDGVAVRPVVRAGGPQVQHAVTGPSLSATADWGPLLKGVDAVIHTAGLARAMSDRRQGAYRTCMEVNAYGTRRLAEQAVVYGVRHFVFISSAQVNGNASHHPFTESDAPYPEGPYAESKLAAEQALIAAAEGSGMTWTIIRPPLVYGTGVRGNFARLVKLLAVPVPLPFASISNRRSFISLANLCDFVSVCLRDPRAANQVFLVSDGADLSTPDLMRLIRTGMGKSPMLFPFPPPVLRRMAGALGQGALHQQLCGDLQVGISKAREYLGWQPPQTPAQGLAAALRPSPRASAAPFAGRDT